MKRGLDRRVKRLLADSTLFQDGSAHYSSPLVVIMCAADVVQFYTKIPHITVTNQSCAQEYMRKHGEGPMTFSGHDCVIVRTHDGSVLYQLDDPLKK